MQRLLTLFVLSLFAVSALPLVPASTPLATPAFADDDDDDRFDWDDDDDDDDDDDWDDRDDRDDDDDDDRRAVAAPVRQEIVVWTTGADELGRVVAAGFVVVAEAPLMSFSGTLARLALPPGISLEAARATIAAIAPAALVDPNHLYRPVDMPCAPGNCPAFEMVGWEPPPSECGVAATVGMIDTQVNTRHPALAARTIDVVSLVDRNERASGAAHGTAIAALLVGDGGARVPGLLPKARLVAVEAFHRDRLGDAADAFKIVRAIDALSVRGVRIANLSFAGPPNALIEAIVGRAASNGMVLVAAAGNLGPGAPPAYPAAYDNVIAVTAIDKDGNVFRQAGQGEHIDFSAPGVRLWTAASESGGRFRSGTSYAVPFVTAAVAAWTAAAPDANVAAVVEGLRAGSVDLGAAGRDPVFGWGAVRGACPGIG